MAPPRRKALTASYYRLDARRIARLHGWPVGHTILGHQLADEWGRPECRADIDIDGDAITATWGWPSRRTATVGTIQIPSGHRLFLCPGCDRRCAIVYLHPRQAPGCRVCMDLGYASQSEGPLRRAFRRRDKFAASWGWDVADPLERPRPKWRRRRAYVTARFRLAELEAATLGGLAARLERMTPSA